MDMFPDTALVREIQQDLDQIIQQGVRNITRLIRATDPNITESMQTQGGRRVTGGAASSKGQKGQIGQGEAMPSSLAGRLVRDGLLTPDLLRQLQREWSKDQKQESTSALDTEHHQNPNNKGKRRRKKK